jgi:hypothetical protein
LGEIKYSPVSIIEIKERSKKEFEKQEPLVFIFP